MPVITLSREMGSRGDDIALTVATRLGLRLIGREVINRAARQAGAPEVALAEIDELGLLGVKPGRAALRRYREKVGDVLRELAAAGDVLLVGRGGQVVLGNTPGVLHVRVIASPALRIQTVQSRCFVPAEVAAARIAASDRARAGFLRLQHGVRWDDPRLYDLVVNIGRIDVATAVDLICLAAGQRSGMPRELPAPEGCEG